MEASSSDPPSATPRYSASWTDEYAALADVDLVVDGDVLPAHSQVLGASPVFSHALFQADDGILDGSSQRPVSTNTLGAACGTGCSERTRIESAFVGVPKEDVYLLLDHLYPTDAFFRPGDVDTLRRLAKIADQFGFEQLAQKCINTLANYDCVAGLRAFLNQHENGKIADWVWLAQKMDSSTLKDTMAEHLARNFDLVLQPAGPSITAPKDVGFRAVGRRKAKTLPETVQADWQRVQELVKVDGDLMFRVALCLHKGVSAGTGKDGFDPYRSAPTRRLSGNW